jgi:octanoyl-[GcvH]:protein N-octanoyltransferase
MRLTGESHPDRPALDMALTGTLLNEVAAGHEAGVIRIFRPGPTLALGRRDRLRDGFIRANDTAWAHGYVPVVRHGGGLAVAYDLSSVIVEIIRPEQQVVGDLERRFQDMSALIAATLGGLGVDTVAGELPGEYCPGRFSLHLDGGAKIVGMAQRIIRGASLTTAVISVGEARPVRVLLTEVYAALALELDPATVGAVVDRHPSVTAARVLDALATSALGLLDVSPREPEPPQV